MKPRPVSLTTAPLIVSLKGGDFVTVPCIFHLKDIVSFPFTGWNAAAYGQVPRDEFDHDEGSHRRRIMVVSPHDRIRGHANRVRALDRFLIYSRSKPDVWFARKNEIAHWALTRRAATSVVRQVHRPSLASLVRRPDAGPCCLIFRRASGDPITCTRNGEK